MDNKTPCGRLTLAGQKGLRANRYRSVLVSVVFHEEADEDGEAWLSERKLVRHIIPVGDPFGVIGRSL